MTSFDSHKENFEQLIELMVDVTFVNHGEHLISPYDINVMKSYLHASVNRIKELRDQLDNVHNEYTNALCDGEYSVNGKVAHFDGHLYADGKLSLFLQMRED